MPQQPADIVAFLIDKGNPSFVDTKDVPEPWAKLVQALSVAEPLERPRVLEGLLDEMNGDGDAIREEVYVALNARFASKQRNSLDVVPPVMEDEKERVDPAFLRRCLETEEDGDATLFVELYHGQVVHDHSENRWYLWNGQYWEEDRTNAVINLIRTECAAQYAYTYADLIAADKPEAAKPYSKRAERLHTRRRKEHVLWGAASRAEIALSGDEWDSNPWLLATPNGVIDLQTGKFRSGRPDDWIRTVIPTSWEGIDAPAPRWERFISEIFDHDRQIAEYIHRLLGYGITGLTAEPAFPVLWGPQGRNGKTTLLETLKAVLGPEIAMMVPSDEIMATYRQTSGPQPYIARLRGKRIVWSSETNPDRRLDQETVKRLTGGDTITAHDKYKSPVEFSPTHLLLLLTNHKPKIEAADNAIWDRVHLIPFNLRFVEHPVKENERPRDAHLLRKLEEERAGILAWLVRGCLDWQAEQSLKPPQSVLLATDEYRTEVDTVAQFLEDIPVKSYDARVGHRELYKEYVAWCKDLRLYPSGSRDFGAVVGQQYEKKRYTTGMMYLGIGLPLKGSPSQLTLDEET